MDARLVQIRKNKQDREKRKRINESNKMWKKIKNERNQEANEGKKKNII